MVCQVPLFTCHACPAILSTIAAHRRWAGGGGSRSAVFLPAVSVAGWRVTLCSMCDALHVVSVPHFPGSALVQLRKNILGEPFDVLRVQENQYEACHAQLFILLYPVQALLWVAGDTVVEFVLYAGHLEAFPNSRGDHFSHLAGGCIGVGTHDDKCGGAKSETLSPVD